MKSFAREYERSKSLIDQRLYSCITKTAPVSLYAPMKYVLSGGGKRVRPMLVILSCTAVGGSLHQALPAAVAIEILHNFTLVHDDIMDNANSRRGRATVHTKWDSNVAILVGDELVALAYRELLKSKTRNIGQATRIFTEGVVEVCEGQAYDKEFESRKQVTLAQYLLMISKKTGKMFSVASEMGAVIGNGSPKEIQALKMYGVYAGKAFQIQDDLLDVVADEKNFGKAIGGDIVEGKKTYLLIQAYRYARGKDKQLLWSIINGHGTSKKNVPSVRTVYEQYGIVDLAKRDILRSIRQANRQLTFLKGSETRDMLFWFSEMLMNREF
jgi:geranylgeranyl diphosphate synthase, type II